MRDIAAGLDFGTTNSSIAIAGADGRVALARFPYVGGFTEAFRSLLYLERSRTVGRATTHSWTGPAAIERYLEAEEKGRLIQSLKSFLSSRTLKGTEVFGRQHTLEHLIAVMLRDIRAEAERQFHSPLTNVVVGRPVRFVGSESAADDEYAQSRLEAALRLAGFERISFEFEPVGAAYHYESTLDNDELILIGDFGGGTSDFSMLQVGRTIRQRGRRPQDLLANEGIGIAGDSFDGKIVRHLVSPALGDGTSMRSMHKILPVPTWVYRRLERWHHLSFLKAKEVIDMLQSVERSAFEPERIAALLHLIQNDLGYHLHRSVQELKSALSESDHAIFRFMDADAYIEAGVERRDFESWIAEELAAIEECVVHCVKQANVAARDVDRVFLTGGSSFVPAVRQIFERRFGAGRIRCGHEFTSVARGLALCAQAHS
ncbi:MAG: Hsp70 family protein [Bryobacteraceae bacterium]